jgi:hypothetical protein
MREKCDASQRCKNLLLDTYSPMHKKRKRKSKQEVKERMEDKIIEQGKRINVNSNSSVPEICYKCEMICEKYSLQENELILRSGIKINLFKKFKDMLNWNFIQHGRRKINSIEEFKEEK